MGHRGEALLLLIGVRPELEVTDGDGDDVRQLGIRLSRLELADVRLARIVDHAVDEAGDVDELHLHDKGCPSAVPAPNVQDGQLRSDHEGKLLAWQVLDGLDGVVAGALEQVVEQAPQDVRVRREDAPEDEVVLQVGERHALPLPEPRH
jgi:hypothetical protein